MLAKGEKEEQKEDQKSFEKENLNSTQAAKKQRGN